MGQYGGYIHKTAVKYQKFKNDVGMNKLKMVSSFYSPLFHLEAFF